ncbi:MAG: NAD-binding protein [Chloroflexi bacterium]|nr:NAD-binding protein [Chloroflexota bacterium]
MGYRVAALLHQLGEPAVAITQQARPAWLQTVRAWGIPTLVGDARDPQLLAQAGITRARAVLALTDQDVVNLEIALDAQEACQTAPLVVRLFDHHLAPPLAAAFPRHRVLDVAALAAPAFAAAAVGEQVVASFHLDSARFVVGRRRVPPWAALAGAVAAPTVRDLQARYGVAVLSRTPASPAGSPREVSAGAPTFAPRGATPLHPGDQVLVLGRMPQWEQLCREWPAAGSPPVPTNARPHGRGQRPLRTRSRPEPPAYVWLGAWLQHAWHLVQDVPPPLRLVFATLVGLILLSVFVFSAALELTLVDAFYFVTSTVTTVGYGDITPRDAAPVVKLYASLLMMLGSATIAVLYSIITDIIVTMRLQQLLGRHRPPQAGHVVVAGLGNVGTRVVDELARAGVPVVAVDRTPDESAAAESLTTVIRGDARRRDSLLKVGITGARALVAVTNDDATNLSVALLAKQLNPQLRTVVRLLDADFARKLAPAPALDVALSAPLLAAPAFVAAALAPPEHTVCAAFVVDGTLCSVQHLPTPATWHGRASTQVRAAETAAIVMRRHRGRGADETAYVPAVDSDDTDDTATLRATEPLVMLTWRPLRANDGLVP